MSAVWYVTEEASPLPPLLVTVTVAVPTVSLTVTLCTANTGIVPLPVGVGHALGLRTCRPPGQVLYAPASAGVVTQAVRTIDASATRILRMWLPPTS
jgi:hypothetical protein